MRRIKKVITAAVLTMCMAVSSLGTVKAEEMTDEIEVTEAVDVETESAEADAEDLYEDYEQMSEREYLEAVGLGDLPYDYEIDDPEAYKWDKKAKNVSYLDADTVIESEMNYGANKTIKAYGIDVSTFQGVIDWKKVKASGISFAIIRVGIRGYGSGKCAVDSKAIANLDGATAAGIDIGVYFFSTAVSVAEARDDADYVVNLIKKYKITYPVVYDYEGWENEAYRNHNTSWAVRNDCAFAFLDRIATKGYIPMMYASKGGFTNNNNWNAKRMSNLYNMWVAQYPLDPKVVDPNAKGVRVFGDYVGKYTSYNYTNYDMWQCSGQGIVDGVPNACDLDIEYNPGVSVLLPSRQLWLDDDGGDMVGGMLLTTPNPKYHVQYSYYLTNDNGKSWTTISDWSETKTDFVYKINKLGYLKFVGKARYKEFPEYVTEAEDTIQVKVIKGICQIPYSDVAPGEPGYYIGLESFPEYGTGFSYELLIYDCTAQAWIMSSGKLKPNTNCMWTVWQPEYGYFWTLFRVYDSKGTLLDEECYGFENICEVPAQSN